MIEQTKTSLCPDCAHEEKSAQICFRHLRMEWDYGRGFYDEVFCECQNPWHREGYVAPKTHGVEIF